MLSSQFTGELHLVAQFMGYYELLVNEEKSRQITNILQSVLGNHY